MVRDFIHFTHCEGMVTNSKNIHSHFEFLKYKIPTILCLIKDCFKLDLAVTKLNVTNHRVWVWEGNGSAQTSNFSSGSSRVLCSSHFLQFSLLS